MLYTDFSGRLSLYLPTSRGLYFMHRRSASFYICTHLRPHCLHHIWTHYTLRLTSHLFMCTDFRPVHVHYKSRPLHVLSRTSGHLVFFLRRFPISVYFALVSDLFVYMHRVPSSFFLHGFPTASDLFVYFHRLPKTHQLQQ